MPKSGRWGKSSKSTYIGIAVLVAFAATGLAYFATRGPGNQTSASPLQISPQNPVLGSSTAKFTIFEFGDFQCPTCDYWSLEQEQSVVHDLVDTGQAKLVWRDFIIYDSGSRVAAEAAYAAGEQGKFWQFHDLLYANQGKTDSGWVTPQLMVSFAQRLGLNVTEFTQSMNSGKWDSLIDGNFQAGREAGVLGTPTFFVVGPTGKSVSISGAQPESAFQEAIYSLGGG